MDRLWGIWGSYSNIPKAVFYLLKGGYRLWGVFIVRGLGTRKQKCKDVVVWVYVVGFGVLGPGFGQALQKTPVCGGCVK